MIDHDEDEYLDSILDRYYLSYDFTANFMSKDIGLGEDNQVFVKHGQRVSMHDFLESSEVASSDHDLALHIGGVSLGDLHGYSSRPNSSRHVEFMAPCSTHEESLANSGSSSLQFAWASMVTTKGVGSDPKELIDVSTTMHAGVGTTCNLDAYQMHGQASHARMG